MEGSSYTDGTSDAGSTRGGATATGRQPPAARGGAKLIQELRSVSFDLQGAAKNVSGTLGGTFEQAKDISSGLSFLSNTLSSPPWSKAKGKPIHKGEKIDLAEADSFLDI